MLSVIVPAYREGPHIYSALEVLFGSLDQTLARPYEVIVVSDGPDEHLAEEVARHRGRARLVDYEQRRGKGYALRRGVARADGEHIAFIDADMELHPDGIGPLLELVQGGADVAIGSKRHPRSRVAYPRFRRLQSAVYQALIRLLFGLSVRDTQTGLKVFRGDLLREVVPDVRSDGFAFDLELLVALHDAGATIVEGPVDLDYRFQTTTTLSAILDVLRDTFRIFWARRRWGRAPTPPPSAGSVDETAPGRSEARRH